MPNPAFLRATLKTGGVILDGWTSVKVCLALEQLAGTFEIGITAQNAAELAQYRLGRNTRCTVSLGGQLAITGWIDACNPTYDKGEHGITIKGRDVTCDLVDCQRLDRPTQWQGATMLDLASAVCKSHNIPVAVETDIGAAFPIGVKYDEGDTVMAFLVKHAKQRALILTSYGDGKLWITRAAMAGAGGSLVLGENIEMGSGNFNGENRFSEYVVKGQSMGTAWKGNSPEETAEFQASYTGPRGIATDSLVGQKRYRPKVIISEVPGTSEQFAVRARHEAAVAAGKSCAASYTVSGWGPALGKIWRINTIVQINDPWMGLVGPYLIERCEYSLDSQGSRTQIGVIHPDAYSRRAEEPTDEASKIALRGMDQPN